MKHHIKLYVVEGWYCRGFIHGNKLLILNRIAPVGGKVFP